MSLPTTRPKKGFGRKTTLPVWVMRKSNSLNSKSQRFVFFPVCLNLASLNYFRKSRADFSLPQSYDLVGSRRLFWGWIIVSEFALGKTDLQLLLQMEQVNKNQQQQRVTPSFPPSLHDCDTFYEFWMTRWGWQNGIGKEARGTLGIFGSEGTFVCGEKGRRTPIQSSLIRFWSLQWDLERKIVLDISGITKRFVLQSAFWLSKCFISCSTNLSVTFSNSWNCCQDLFPPKLGMFSRGCHVWKKTRACSSLLNR